MPQDERGPARLSVAFLPLGFAVVAPLSSVLERTGLLLLASVSWLVLTGAVLAVPSVRRLTDRAPA